MKQFKSLVVNPFIYVLVIVLQLSSQLKAQTYGESPDNISGNVKINLADSSISYSLHYNYTNVEGETDLIRFKLIGWYIKVGKISCDGVESFSIDSTDRRRWGDVISLKLKRKIKAKEHLRISFECRGKLPINMQVYRDYGAIELTCNELWFPLHINVNDWRFTYKLKVEIDDESLVLFNNGSAVKKDNVWTVSSTTKDYDMTFFFLRNPQVWTKSGKYKVEIISSNENSALKDSILNSTYDVVNFYNSTFGSVKPLMQVRGILRPLATKSSRFKPGGYSRADGFFIIPSPRVASRAFELISHEVSHYWWINARYSEKENWLNESFAEYSAMMSWRHFVGEDKFNQRINDKRLYQIQMKNEGKVVPPVFGAHIDPSDPMQTVSAYGKGPVLLAELESEIGKEKFQTLLQKLIANKTNKTSEFIKLLEEVSNKIVAADFLNKLKNR